MNGDLISREALKKALKSNCDLCHDKNTNWCEHCCPLNDFEDLIDNAPTVDTYTIEDIKEVQEKSLILGAKLAQRPQGEDEITNEDIQQAIKEGFANGYEMAKAKLVKTLKDRIEESVCKYCQMNKHCELCEISRVFQIITLATEEQKGGAE